MAKDKKRSELDDAEELQDEFTLAKHSVKHKQTERIIRKKRKKVNRLKTFFRLIVFALLVYLTYEFIKLPQWYLPQDAFKKHNSSVIEIVNNRIVSTPIIYDAMKDIPVSRLPIFLTDTEPIQKALYKIPPIKNVYIRRYAFPARIQIIVRERIPVVILKLNLNQKPVAFFTTDGVLVTDRRFMNFADSASTLKILINSPKLPQDWNFAKIVYIQKIVKAVETYSGEKVEYIDMKNPNDVYVTIQSTSIRLGTLDSTVFDRIKRIYTILPQIKDLNSRIKYVDLSWDKVNYLKLKKSK